MNNKSQVYQGSVAKVRSGARPQVGLRGDMRGKEPGNLANRPYNRERAACKEQPRLKLKGIHM
jgi:hypothetical protein